MTCLGQHFCGSTVVLRVLAWLSFSGLLLGWVCFALMAFGSHHSLGVWWATAHFGAFVLGMSSFCPLGGFSAGFAVLTFLGALVFLGGGASC